MARVAVFSAGSWGTAFGLVLADAGNDVVLHARRDDVCANINDKHENTEYFPGVELPSAVRATTSADEALDGAQFVVVAAGPGGRRLPVVDEGCRARHHQEDERGDR
jgi:glycerol-3-phosphate dehydrogenase (NAD(P)+)